MDKTLKKDLRSIANSIYDCGQWGAAKLEYEIRKTLSESEIAQLKSDLHSEFSKVTEKYRKLKQSELNKKYPAFILHSLDARLGYFSAYKEIRMANNHLKRVLLTEDEAFSCLFRPYWSSDDNNILQLIDGKPVLRSKITIAQAEIDLSDRRRNWARGRCRKNFEKLVLERFETILPKYKLEHDNLEYFGSYVTNSRIVLKPLAA